jgi:hypothetical protein
MPRYRGGRVGHSAVASRVDPRNKAFGPSPQPPWQPHEGHIYPQDPEGGFSPAPGVHMRPGYGKENYRTAPLTESSQNRPHPIPPAHPRYRGQRA